MLVGGLLYNGGGGGGGGGGLSRVSLKDAFAQDVKTYSEFIVSTRMIFSQLFQAQLVI